LNLTSNTLPNQTIIISTKSRSNSLQEKKCFNGGYLAEVNLTLGIDLINGGFFLKPQQNNGGSLTFVNFQRFILKPLQNSGGFFNLR